MDKKEQKADVKKRQDSSWPGTNSKQESTAPCQAANLVGL